MNSANQSKITAIYPLTPLQEGILFHTLADADSRLYVGQVVVHFNAGLRAQEFIEAWKRTIDRHDLLRTGFVWKDVKSPMQVVKKSVDIPWSVEDWRGYDEEERGERLQRLLENDKQQGFDLHRPPLMRFYLLQTGEDSAIWVWTHHHLIMDGWCMSLLIDEALASYRESLLNHSPHVDAAMPFKSYVSWLSSLDNTEAASFWRQYFTWFTPCRFIEPVPPAARVAQQGRQRAELVMGQDDTCLIKEFARSHRTTVGVLAQVAYGVLLARMSGNADVAFGVPVSGRSAAFSGIEKMIGVLVNTVPARVGLARHRTVADVIAETQSNQRNSEMHGHLGLVDIAKEAGVQRGADLFDTLLVVENYPLKLEKWWAQAGLSVDSVQSYDHTNFPFAVMVFPEGDLTLSVSYDPQAYREDFVQRFLDYFHLLFLQIARGAKYIGDLRLESAETSDVCVEVEKAMPERSQALFEAFSARVQREPQGIAIDLAGDSICYGQLADEIGCLSDIFTARPGRPYAVVAHPSVAALTTVFALMHARCNFVIVDPDILSAFVSMDELQQNYQILDGSRQPEWNRGDAAASGDDAQGDAAPRMTFLGINIDKSVSIDKFLAMIEHTAVERALDEGDQVLLCGDLNWMDIVIESSMALCNGTGVLARAVPDDDGAPFAVADGLDQQRSTCVVASTRTVESFVQQLPAAQIRCIEYVGDKLSRSAQQFLEQIGISVHRRCVPPRSFVDIRPRVSLQLGGNRRPCCRIVGDQGCTLPAYIPGHLEVSADAAFCQIVTRSMLDPACRSSWSPSGVYVQSGSRACAGADGSIELLEGEAPVRVRHGELDIEALAADIISSRWAHDVYIQIDIDLQQQERIVVYVSPVSESALQSMCTTLSVLPLIGPWIVLVPVTCIPRAADGTVDHDVLARIPVVDDHLVNILAAPGVTVELLERRQVFESLPTDKLLSLVGDKIEQPRCDGSEATASKPALIEATLLDITSAAQQRLIDCLIDSSATKHSGRLTLVDKKGEMRVTNAAQLLDRSHHTAAGLQAAGIRPGDYILLQIAENESFLVAFWACQLLGAIPVPLANPKRFEKHDAIIRKMANVRAMLNDPLLVTSVGNKACYQAAADLEEISSYRIHSTDDLAHECAIDGIAQIAPTDTCLVMLTSGSTGIPKAVPLTHQNIIHRSRASARLNGFGAHDVSLNWMPLDHVGGIVMSYLRSVVLGEAQVLVDMDYVLGDISRWLELASKHRATYTWAPNFAFALVNQCLDDNIERDWDLSALRFILNGGEAVVAKTAQSFVAKLARYGLPQDAMRPAYGMTETTSAITYSSKFCPEEDENESGSVGVGRPVPGASVRIVDDKGQLLDERRTGRLQVKGPTVFGGYLDNLEANKEAFGPDGWFNTGDLAFVRDGNVTVVGREKDAIIINGVNFNGHEIEAVVEEIPGVVATYTAAVAVRKGVNDSDDLVLFFVRNEGNADGEAALAAAVCDKVDQVFGLRNMYLVAVSREDIPKTEIGKIKREVLRKGFIDGVYVACVLNGLEEYDDARMPSWFYRESWYGTDHLEVAGDPITAPLLVIGADGTLVKKVGERLACTASCVITVEFGSDFAAADEVYTINPAADDHYGRILTDLADRQIFPERIIYLADNAGAVLEQGEAGNIHFDADVAYHLALLTKAIAGASSASQRFLLVAGKGQFLVHKGDVVDPSYAALAGITETARRELSNVSACLLDLGDIADEKLAEILGWELNEARYAPFVAYRSGKRYSLGLERVDVEQSLGRFVPGTSLLRPHGTYVISGGTGGIGRQLLAYLRTQLHASVLILSRSPQTQDDEAHVRYATVDVADDDALAAAICAFEDAVGTKIDAAFHLVGKFEALPLTEFDHDHYQRVVGAKVQGALNLGRILAQRPDASLVVFGSVNGLVGGMGVAAYSAANAALAGVSRAVRAKYAVKTKYMAWSMWEGVGMSRGYAFNNITKRSGFHLINGDRGMSAMRIATALSEDDLYIGINESVGLPDLPVYSYPDSYYLLNVSGEQPSAFTQAQDVLGRIVDASYVVTGDVRLESNSKRSTVEPRDAVERGIAGIWQEVLGREIAGIDENFFDVGGHSLNATQVVSRLNSYFRVNAPITILFQAPTIETLADALRQCAPVSGQVDTVADARERITALDDRDVKQQLELMKNGELS